MLSENIISTIEKLKTSTNLCILVGAGISNKPPTNIPLFSGLRDAYLDAIDPNRTILKKNAGKYANFIETEIRNLKIESFFSDLLTSLGPIIWEPLKWMNSRPLNTYHYLLRDIVDSYKVTTVMTTNFDRLLEKVLPKFEALSSMKSGYKDNIGFFGFPNQKNKNVYPYDKPSIFYLHGQAESNDIDVTIATTSMSFDCYDYDNLSERLRGATLLIIGYGGGDIIDVAPLFTQFNFEEHIWVCHNECEEIKEGPVPEAWLSSVSPNGIGISGNTEKILKLIAGNHAFKEDSPVLGSFSDAVSTCLESVLSKSTRHYLMSCFVNATGHGDIALSILNDCGGLPKNRTGLKWLINKRAKAISMSKSTNDDNRKHAIIYLKNACKIIPFLLPEGVLDEKIKGELRDLARECGLALESLGILYYEAGNIEEAIRLTILAHKYFSENEDVFRVKMHMEVFYRERKIDDIVGKENAKMIDEYENNFDSYVTSQEKDKIIRFLLQMGELIYKKGKNKLLSIRVYELAIKYKPTSIETYVDISSLYMALADLDRAMLTIEKGLVINPSHYKLICNKGFLLNRTGRQREAKTILKQATDINSDDALTWNNLGISHHELGELNEAKDAYIKAVMLDPSLNEARYNLEKVQRLCDRF